MRRNYYGKCKDCTAFFKPKNKEDYEKNVDGFCVLNPAWFPVYNAEEHFCIRCVRG